MGSPKEERKKSSPAFQQCSPNHGLSLRPASQARKLRNNSSAITSAGFALRVRSAEDTSERRRRGRRLASSPGKTLFKGRAVSLKLGINTVHTYSPLESIGGARIP